MSKKEEKVEENCYRVILYWQENRTERKVGVLVNALCAFSALCKMSPLLSNLIINNITKLEVRNVGEPLS